MFAFSFFFLSADQPGSHWCYVENLTPSSDESVLTWVDPFGLPPPLVIVKKILESNQDVRYSDIQIQDPISNICGPACAIFCMLRSRDFSFHEIFFKIFKAGDGDYIRSSALSKIVVGSLINLRNPEVIDWEGISSAIKDYLNKNL